MAGWKIQFGPGSPKPPTYCLW